MNKTLFTIKNLQHTILLKTDDPEIAYNLCISTPNTIIYDENNQKLMHSINN